MASRAVKYKKDAVVLPTVSPFVHALEPRFSDPVRSDRACDWCYVREERHGASLKKCARCHYTNYCSKECQKEDWDNGGHKDECKLFRKTKGYEAYDANGQISELRQRCGLSWGRIIIRMALKLGFDTTLLTKTFKRYDGQEVKWESLPIQECPELANRRNTDRIICLFLTAEFPQKADIWPVVMKDLTAKLFLHTLTVPNTDGMCYQALAFYWEAVGIKKVENPNAVAVYDKNRLKVVANRDIREDEEVSIHLSCGKIVENSSARYF